MAVRGPDGAGVYLNPDSRLGFAHRRLSIIDTSNAGHQPMHSACGRYTITFNGEIYNFKELRADLIARGYAFHSGTDTEVILNLYKEYGEGCFERLRGMFALGIWDEVEQILVLARDPFGIKPVYYSWNGSQLRFASQVKALLRSEHVDRSPEPAGHVGFMLWGSVPEPYTLFKGIRSLDPGSSMRLDANGELKIRRWRNMEEEVARAYNLAHSGHPVKVKPSLRETILDSVDKHLIADVPVGVFLSAGLDSTTIAAHASELTGAPIETRTLAFNEFRGQERDESTLAEQFAKYIGSNHETVYIDKSEFRSDLDYLVASMDQPSIDAINTFFVSKVTAKTGLKVALSGLGGDELFGTYPSFKDIPKHLRRVGLLSRIPGVGKGFRIASSQVLKYSMKPKFAGLIEYSGSLGASYLLRRGLFMPWELGDLFDSDFAREGWNELNTVAVLDGISGTKSSQQLAISALELSQFMRNMLLRDSDWASMAHSLELRVPLVDPSLWTSVTDMIAEGHAPKKTDMARTPKMAMPDEILKRKKTGFEIPVREWLMERQVPTRHKSGYRNWALEIYSLYTGSTSSPAMLLPNI